MFMNDGLMSIIEEVDVLLAEIRELSASGPHFRIVHRFHRPSTICAPGEEIAAVYFVHHGREFCLPLSLPLRILFDYLARHSRLPQSATQIEAGIRADRFYTQHAAAVMGKGKFTRSIPRSYVRVYIERLRSAIKSVLDNAGLPIDPGDVLLSEKTVMNEIGYRMKASFEWMHTNTRAGPT
jgi:hypothetical protein